jgi:hypothetical protein
LQLWLTQHVAVGWRLDTFTGEWQPTPGTITIANDAPVGDALSDAAVATIRRIHAMSPNPDHLRVWLRQFAAADLYERVRANMVTAGVLHRTSRRRLGLLKADAYTAIDPAWAVRARARIAAAVHARTRPHNPGRERPDKQCVALGGLAHVLGLARYLYVAGTTTTQVHEALAGILDQHNRNLRDIIIAVDAERGDLAVAAMR